MAGSAMLSADAGLLYAQAVRDTLADSSSVKLKPVTVTAEREATMLFLGRFGYLERKRTGQGVYLNGAELDERRSRTRDLSDLLRGIPGIRIQGLGGTRTEIQLRGMESIAKPCRTPLVYLNGMQVPATDRELSEAVHVEDLLAIEVYKGSSTLPSEYSGAESGCGVILIWTRHSK
jgi:outer membrane cobalamin receptor